MEVDTLEDVLNVGACRYDATKNIETLRVSDYLNTRVRFDDNDNA